MDPWGPRLSGAEQAQPLGMGAPNYRRLSPNSPVTPLPRLGGRPLQWGLWRERWICVARAPPRTQPTGFRKHGPQTLHHLPGGPTSHAHTPGIEGLEELRGHVGPPSHPGPPQPLRTHPACWGTAHTWQHAPFLAPAGLSSPRPSHPSVPPSCTVPSWL